MESPLPARQLSLKRSLNFLSKRDGNFRFLFRFILTYTTSIFLSVASGLIFAIGPAHTKSAQESQRAAKAATKGGAAPAAPPATSKAAGASAAAAGAGAPPDRTSSAAGAAKSAPAGADGAAKDQRANSGESTKTEVTDPRRPPAR